MRKIPDPCVFIPISGVFEGIQDNPFTLTIILLHHYNYARKPGGSAANVCKGLSMLLDKSPAKVTFIGMIGNDVQGSEYEAMLIQCGVEPLLFQSHCPNAATATCLCLITPDGQRTMRTHLGAATQFSKPEQLVNVPDTGLRLAHFEGYSMYRPNITETAMKQWKTAGAAISLDLASFEVIQHCWETFQRLLCLRIIDILFCNEDEALEVYKLAKLQKYQGSEEENAFLTSTQHYLLKFVDIVVISRGKNGCRIASKLDTTGVQVPAQDVRVVDTVGAGDSFCAGFLYAWIQNSSLEVSGRCGCAAGAAVVQVSGATIPEEGAQSLQQQILCILEGDAR